MTEPIGDLDNHPLKRCARCAASKPSQAFPGDGSGSWCRECTNKQAGVRYADLRATVFAHYGSACACCGTTANLGIDHVAGDGKQHGVILGTRAVGAVLYRWLLANGFPAGYQVLCGPCNSSKGLGAACRIAHGTEPAPKLLLAPPVMPIYLVNERDEIPALAGLAEVAALATEHYGRTISRKRAWELSKHPKFPAPVQELAMGPVWLESDVLGFLAIDRPSGRQPRSGTGTEGKEG